jgi:tripartite-type tricarboxylate transporter receptor subunit TctC
MEQRAFKLDRRGFLQFTGSLMGASTSSPISAADSRYPMRRVRAIVPFAPGGAVDVFARYTCQKLNEQLGNWFHVENVAGAAGNIGTAQAARAKPDGYTILFAFSSHVVNPSLFSAVKYRAADDFDPVTLAVTSKSVLMVNPSVRAKTVSELVALIRESRSKYSFASAGAGTTGHLVGEQFRLSLKLDIVFVHFTGAAPAIESVVAGHIPIGITTLASAISQIEGGQVRALAVSSETRSQVLPDIPSMPEAGYPELVGEGWVGVLVPAGTPRMITDRLHREITRLLGTEETSKRLLALGFDSILSTPDDFSRRIKTELIAWRKLIESAGIRVR